MTRFSENQAKDKPRSVWIVNSNRWNSAITEYSLQLAHVLSKKYYVTYTGKTGCPSTKAANSLGVHVLPMDNFNLTQFDFFKVYHQKIRPFFVITVMGQETALLALVDKNKHETRIRFKGDNLATGLFRKVGFWFSHRSFDAFIAPSQLIEKQLRSQTKKMIYPIDLPRDGDIFKFNPDSLDDSSRNILIFGRLDPVKGHKEFMDIFRIYLDLNADNKDTMLHIYGREENTSFSELEKYAVSKGIGKNILFLEGSIDELGKVFSSMQLGDFIHRIRGHL